MNLKETLSTIRRAWPDVTLTAYENLMEALDILPFNEKSIYPIPIPLGDGIAFQFEGFRLICKKGEDLYVKIDIPTSHHMKTLLHDFLEQYSKEFSKPLHKRG